MTQFMQVQSPGLLAVFEMLDSTGRSTGALGKAPVVGYFVKDDAHSETREFYVAVVNGDGKVVRADNFDASARFVSVDWAQDPLNTFQRVLSGVRRHITPSDDSPDANLD